MFLIGLTGGIASGKSTVSGIFIELGCPVIDADKVARDVVEPGKPAWKLIQKHFGSDILLPDGNIDRQKLGSIIFADASKRKVLNSCTHPYIQREMIWQSVKYMLQGHRYVIMDVPLLFDGPSALKWYMNQTVVVYCDEKTQLDRLRSRNADLDQNEAENRIRSQLPLVEKCQLADHVIDNSGSLGATREAALQLHRTFDSSYSHWKLRTVFLFTGLTFFGMVSYFLRSLF